MSSKSGDGHTVHINEMISVIRLYYEKRIEYLEEENKTVQTKMLNLEEENKTVQRKMVNLEEVGAPFVFFEIIGLTFQMNTFKYCNY